MYVGDTILTSNDMHEMEILKQLMAKEFEAKGHEGIIWESRLQGHKEGYLYHKGST